MALLQISEVDETLPTAKHKKLAVGIDLGTTNSLVAIMKDDKVVTLKDSNNQSLIPSVVYYAKDGAILVGDDALKYRVVDPLNTIVSVKRYMGRKTIDLLVNKNNISYLNYDKYNFIEDTDSNIINIATNQGLKNVIEISSEILKKLKQIATDNLDEEITSCVITVPAYFDDASRQATKIAAEMAGLNVLRLLNEPTAAAIAYGFNSKNEGLFLVYDLGGGTLDVSILRLTKGVFEVIAVSGDTQLGGDDFDQVIYEYILGQLFINKIDINKLTEIDKSKILHAAKLAKESLTNNAIATVSLDLTTGYLSIQVVLDEFNLLCQKLLDRAILPVKQAIRDAKVELTDIDEIIMVGGATRMLNIRERVTQFFSRKLLTEIDPDRVVAIGAAIQADILVGNKHNDWLLLDVTPLSLGIETMGGIVEKIIPRNSTLPIIRTQEFTTYQDGQTGILIHIVQGERELVSGCRSLARFSLKGIPPMAAGAAKVKITFQIDADGLLSVTAVDQTTGIMSSIEVKPSFGLDAKQIQNMLQSSISNARHDMQLRNLVEVKTNAKGLIVAVEQALITDRKLLNDEEYLNILEIIQELKDALDVVSSASNDSIDNEVLHIKKLNDRLNQVTQNFAIKRMNEAVASGLTGKNIQKL